MGTGWTHSYQWYVLRDTGRDGFADEPTEKIYLVTPSGRMDEFIPAPAAAPTDDFNGDGIYDFFYVSIFLALYNAGCP